MTDLTIATLTKYYLVDQIKKSGMGGAGSTCGGQERCIHCFGWEI